MQDTMKTTLLVGVLVAIAGPARADLVATANGLGVYDTVNNVTWTSDGNLFKTQAAGYAGGASAFVSAVIAASGGVIHDTPNGYDTVPNSGTHVLDANDFQAAGGGLSWWGAQAWVHYLNVIGYGGSTQWALPTTVDSPSSNGGSGGSAAPPTSSSQLAQLFYGGLGQRAGFGIDTIHTGAYALFSNLQVNGVYWSATESSANFANAWSYGPGSGYQIADAKYAADSAIAVTNGQLAAVPLPGSAWLLGSSLLGLAGVVGRRAAGIRAA